MVPFALYGEFKGWPYNVGTLRYGEEHKLNEIALISVADTLFDYCARVLNYSTSAGSFGFRLFIIRFRIDCVAFSHLWLLFVYDQNCLIDWLFFFQVGWLKAEDQTVLTLRNHVVTHNSRITVYHDNLRTWQLRIRQLRETDRGCYMCQINTSPMKKQLGCIDVHGKYNFFYK